MVRLCFSVSPRKLYVQQHDCLLLLWLIGPYTVTSDPLSVLGNGQNPAAASPGTGNTRAEGDCASLPGHLPAPEQPLGTATPTQGITEEVSSAPTKSLSRIQNHHP